MNPGFGFFEYAIVGMSILIAGILFYAYMAGGGCTLLGKAMVLMPGAGYEGVTKFVMDVMASYGLNACPPLLFGVSVATSVETAALLSKKR